MKHRDLVREVAATAALTGVLPCSVYGTGEQLLAFSEAFAATRRFDRLLAESKDLDAVVAALSSKRVAAARFRAVFGVRWPA